MTDKSIATGNYPFHLNAHIPPTVTAKVFTDSVAVTPHVNILIDHHKDDVEVGGRKLGISMTPDRAMAWAGEVFAMAYRAQQAEELSG